MRTKSALMAATMLFALAEAARADESAPAADPICALIETAAKAQNLPVSFLTRLIWRESSFQTDVTSSAGAEGIAQFMPGTAAQQGLANPYDPEQAIPKAAELLVALKTQFGNLGLAAAAYNAGPTRVANWVAGSGGLPYQTRDYVLAITGHAVEEWTTGAAADKAGDTVFPKTSCAEEVAAVRVAQPVAAAMSGFTAPWGVQISGSFSKAAALAVYQRAQTRYASFLGNVEPMVIGGRLRSRGFSTFYRVRAPAATRADARALCVKILRAGGACVVLRSV
jgi:hypothetical protein